MRGSHEKAALPTKPRPPSAESGAWLDLDWRFLLAEPALGVVWVPNDHPDDTAALRSIGIEVTSEFQPPVDFAFAYGESVDLATLETSLRPATPVRILILRRPKGASWWYPAHRWAVWRRLLESRGWEVVVSAWSAPNAARPRAYAPVDAAGAIRYFADSSASRKGAVLAAILRIGLRLGSVGLVDATCREGVIVARTPL